MTERRLAGAVPRYARLGPCRNRAGYETEASPPLRLDLADAERRAPAHGLEPLVNAGSILVLRDGDVEFSLFDSGKMLFKTRDAERARGTMMRAMALVGEPWEEPVVERAHVP